MSGPSLFDHQSIPDGYFVDSSSFARIRDTGISQECKNGSLELRRKRDVPTQYLHGLALPCQDLSHLVKQGLGKTLSSVPNEETTVSVQLSRAADVLKRLPDSKTRAQQFAKYAKESNWLVKNGHRYAGRWIALDGDQLLADGATAKEVFAIVENLPTPPLVVQVAEDDLPFAGW
jgi:hypothetical protein